MNNEVFEQLQPSIVVLHSCCGWMSPLCGVLRACVCKEYALTCGCVSLPVL